MTIPLGLRSPRSDAAVLALSLDRRLSEPLAVQLVRQLRELILAGRIGRGARLPSSRALAGELGVSRATVVLAFDQLASEGCLEGRHGAGMYVPAALPEQAPAGGPGARLAGHRSQPPPSPLDRPPPYRPFQVGAVDPALIPFEDWSRRFARIWRSPRPELTGVPDPFGWADLRAAVSGHLAAWRGIAADPARIVITSGTADAIELIAAAAFPPGASVVVEEPGYPSLRAALNRCAITTVPVPVDAEGLDMSLAPPSTGAVGAIVTPSRQFPLGGTLPLARRLALLDWAERKSRFVVEDDFDSEYRYEGTPLPALTSLDRGGRVIYVGSFSKTLMPTLRLGFIVLPERLVEPARGHLRRRGVLASLMLQPVLAEFIGSGEYATHIRRSRRIYARRLAALLGERERLAGWLELEPTSAGMHVVASLGPRLARVDDHAVAAAARKSGVLVAALADYHAASPTRRAVLMGFAGFDEPALAAAVDRLATVLRRL